MNQRKVLEIASGRAKDLWIFVDDRASEAGYKDPVLNNLEEELWKVYENCCLLYMDVVDNIRKRVRSHDE